MSPPEDSYGRVKRLEFIGAVIAAASARRILDVGCGAGTQLTAPLAAAHPAAAITAIDEDPASIAWARRNLSGDNILFLDPARLSADERFDLVIASEVLEHVADPAAFLLALRRRLTPEGRLVITVPNGYGAFEWMALAEALLNLSGAQIWLRRLKGGRRPSAQSGSPDTLAVSPHVNFFSFGELRRLFADTGLAISCYRPRTVLCGYLLDSALRHPRILALNAAFADRLPAWCASDWMFELRPVAPPGVPRWRRGAWARLRKRINERRWQVKAAETLSRAREREG